TCRDHIEFSIPIQVSYLQLLTSHTNAIIKYVFLPCTFFLYIKSYPYHTIFIGISPTRRDLITTGSQQIGYSDGVSLYKIGRKFGPVSIFTGQHYMGSMHGCTGGYERFSTTKLPNLDLSYGFIFNQPFPGVFPFPVFIV